MREREREMERAHIKVVGNDDFEVDGVVEQLSLHLAELVLHVRVRESSKQSGGLFFCSFGHNSSIISS